MINCFGVQLKWLDDIIAFCLELNEDFSDIALLLILHSLNTVTSSLILLEKKYNYLTNKNNPTLLQ